MPEILGGNTLLTMTVLVFVSVLLLLEGLYLFWQAKRGPQARQLQRRLRALADAAGDGAQSRLLKHKSLEGLTRMQRLVATIGHGQRLEHLIHQAGMSWRPTQLLLGCMALALAGLVAASGFAHLPLLPAVGVGLACAALPLLHLMQLQRKRLALFEQQLPEALDLIGRALRAGHSFGTGVQMVGEEMNDPIAGEFRLVSEEVNFGVSLQQALGNLGERVPLTDLRYFVVAVLIQRDSGGNLTEVLGNLSRLVRERHKLLARVRVLSAEGRLSAWILGLMPFGLAALLNTFNPEFMQPLWTDPIGQAVVKTMLALMLVGAVLLRAIIRIRV
ncbi:MAG: type II secretion system F family protein [Proteobacteria bacterium]|nr:type II secretion system F family protein [Pseudomonadota bacterium]